MGERREREENDGDKSRKREDERGRRTEKFLSSSLGGRAFEPSRLCCSRSKVKKEKRPLFFVAHPAVFSSICSGRRREDVSSAPARRCRGREGEGAKEEERIRFASCFCTSGLLLRSSSVALALSLSPPPKRKKKHPEKNLLVLPLRPSPLETTPPEQSSRVLLQLQRERCIGEKMVESERAREREDGREKEFFIRFAPRASLGATSMPPHHQSKKTKNASLQTLTTCTRPSLSTTGAFGSLTQPPLGGARWNAGLSGHRGGSSRRFDCGAANISMPTPPTTRRCCSCCCCCCALLLLCGLAACATTRSWPRPLRL